MNSQSSDPDDRTESSTLTRRGGLKLLGLGFAASCVPTVGRAATSKSGTYSISQGTRCLPITPLSGDTPVEKLYDYTYPMDQYDGSPGSSGYTYSAAGHTDLQRDDTSTLFLYDGPKGLSLVIVHGKLHKTGGESGSGAATFRFADLPSSAKWVVQDDLYLDKDTGKPHSTNYDEWSTKNGYSRVNWIWGPNRTDGGVLGDLGTAFSITIVPAFNRRASLYKPNQSGSITDWQVLTGGLDSPKRVALDLTEPVTLASKGCSSATQRSAVEVPMALAPKTVNARLHGDVTAVVRPTDSVDVSTIPPELTTLEPGYASPVESKTGNQGQRIFQFDIDDLDLHDGNVSFTLSAMTPNGHPVVGRATTRITKYVEKS